MKETSPSTIHLIKEVSRVEIPFYRWPLKNRLLFGLAALIGVEVNLKTEDIRYGSYKKQDVWNIPEKRKD